MTFENLGLAADLLKAVEQTGYTTPTPVQVQAIPAAIAYNGFARANRNTLARLNAFAYDVFAFLATGIKTSPMRTDARDTSEKVIAMARSSHSSAVGAAFQGV